uniref:FH2 domain-containing protein n=1 Tax=Pygocentrus nattereri TaxID=42514 RepID=A0AAR2K700_PYGNA
MVCSIVKGIVKRQFPFMEVTNCHDAAGTKFSVSFKGRHDYELEAMSPEDKQKILELINQIIYRNVHPVDIHEEPSKPPASPTKLHEGLLLLQRGGLASCKWKNLRVPLDEQSTEDVRNERDAWVKAINRQCMDWKRRSQCENMYEDLKEAQKLSDITKVIKENQSTHERGPETGKMQNNHAPLLVPPQPFPRFLSKSGAVAVPIPVPAPALEPVNKPSMELEQVPELKPPPMQEKSPVTFPESRLAPIPQLESIQSLMFSAAPTPPPPLPPPLPKKKTKSQIMRTRAFHWDLIAQDKIAKSVWARGSPREIEIDTSRLYEQFGVKDLANISNLESSNHVEIMLSAKIAHNFNIFLKSFPVQPKELKDKLFIVNEGDGGLSDEHITSLRRYVPTADDKEMYRSYKGDVSELHLVDQYMLELCNIPYLSSQLDLLLTLRELPISMDDLKPLINQKIRMCQQLWGCEAFVCVLEYLLAMGNYLNQNAGKEKAKGFRLSSLTKISQLRGNEKRFTLMHALVEQIMLHEPRLATFFRELAEFEMVPWASVKGLTAEVDVVKNELQKVIQYRKTYKGKNLGSQHSKFTKDLKLAIEKYEADLYQLTKRCEEMRKLYTDILVIPELLFQYLLLCCPGRRMGPGAPCFVEMGLLD